MTEAQLDAIRKLKVEDGDVLMLPQDVSPSDINKFMDTLRELATPPERVMVIVGPLDKLSEADMNAAGWYRSAPCGAGLRALPPRPDLRRKGSRNKNSGPGFWSAFLTCFQGQRAFACAGAKISVLTAYRFLDRTTWSLTALRRRHAQHFT